MTVNRYRYRDARGHVYSGASATPPPGMTLIPDGVSPVFADKQGVKVDMMMMDSVQRDVAATHAGLTDTAGPTALITDSHRSLGDTLAACPRATADIQHKAARHLIDAKTALTDGAFDNAIRGLQSMSGQYLTRSHLAADEAEKATLSKAADAVNGTVDALLAARHGKSPARFVDAEAARRHHIAELNNRWRQ